MVLNTKQLSNVHIYRAQSTGSAIHAAAATESLRESILIPEKENLTKRHKNAGSTVPEKGARAKPTAMSSNLHLLKPCNTLLGRKASGLSPQDISYHGQPLAAPCLFY